MSCSRLHGVRTRDLQIPSPEALSLGQLTPLILGITLSHQTNIDFYLGNTSLSKCVGHVDKNCQNCQFRITVSSGIFA